jgi:nitrilase
MGQPMESKFLAAAVQAEPVYFNALKTAEKAAALIDDAGRQGVQLVTFPETWLPGYPYWIWLGSPAWGMHHFILKYHQNSPVAGGPEEQILCQAARRNGIFVVMGLSEKIGASLYMAQWFISPDGKVIARRRKLKPTHVERSVFGEGDGSDIIVLDTPLGKLGGLCCWEHMQPLSKYAMYSQGEQIHAGAWPSISVYADKIYVLGSELNGAANQIYAAEGQCFVLASWATVSQAGIDLFCDTPDKAALMKIGGGFSQIYGPDGCPLAKPLPEDVEGLVCAEIDLSAITRVKAAADPVGHYSRPDVFRLLFNRTRQERVVSADTVARFSERPTKNGLPEEAATPPEIAVAYAAE